MPEDVVTQIGVETQAVAPAQERLRDETTLSEYLESLLVTVAEFVEEWLTSAESLGIAEPRRNADVVPYRPRAVQA